MKSTCLSLVARFCCVPCKEIQHRATAIETPFSRRSFLRNITRTTPNSSTTHHDTCYSLDFFRDSNFPVVNIHNLDLTSAINILENSKETLQFSDFFPQGLEIEQSLSSMMSVSHFKPHALLCGADIEFTHYSGKQHIQQIRPFGSTALVSTSTNTRKKFLSSLPKDFYYIIVIPMNDPAYSAELYQNILSSLKLIDNSENFSVVYSYEIKNLDLFLRKNTHFCSIVEKLSNKPVAFLQPTAQPYNKLPQFLKEYFSESNLLSELFIRAIKEHDDQIGKITAQKFYDTFIGSVGYHTMNNITLEEFMKHCEQYSINNFITVRKPKTDKAFTCDYTLDILAIQDLLKKPEGLIIEPPNDAILTSIKSNLPLSSMTYQCYYADEEKIEQIKRKNKIGGFLIQISLQYTKLSTVLVEKSISTIISFLEKEDNTTILLRLLLEGEDQLTLLFLVNNNNVNQFIIALSSFIDVISPANYHITEEYHNNLQNFLLSLLYLFQQKPQKFTYLLILIFSEVMSIETARKILNTSNRREKNISRQDANKIMNTFPHSLDDTAITFFKMATTHKLLSTKENKLIPILLSINRYYEEKYHYSLLLTSAFIAYKRKKKS